MKHENFYTSPAEVLDRVPFKIKLNYRKCRQAQKICDTLLETQCQKIIELYRECDTLTVAQTAESLCIDEDTARQHLASLRRIEVLTTECRDCEVYYHFSEARLAAIIDFSLDLSEIMP